MNGWKMEVADIMAPYKEVYKDMLKNNYTSPFLTDAIYFNIVNFL
jgi:hypothetical protein